MNNKQISQPGVGISSEQLTTALQGAQDWVKEHKVISVLAAAAVLYFIGGKRIRSLIGVALKSGATAGLANAALTTVLPGRAPKAESVESTYH